MNSALGPGVETPYFNTYGPTDVTIATNGKRVRVEIELMAAGEDVARHNFKDGQTQAKIFLSEHARPNDVTRALAHELAEIQSIAAGAQPNRPALTEGSASVELDAHDYGRKAEVHTLLFEIDQTERTHGSNVDQRGELKALVTHLGFKSETIGSDPRAKQVLGAGEVARIDEILNKPRIVVRPNGGPPKGKMVGRTWEFTVQVDIPGKARPVDVVDGSITMKPDPSNPGKYIVDETQTLDFTIKKTSDVNGREMRIEIEGHKQLTDFVMAEAIKQFNAEFHQKPALGGLLAWDNKAAFQHAYAAVEETAVKCGKKLSPQQIADQAILATKYGEARVKVGYLVTTTITGTTQIVTGNPPRFANVPERITAEAHPQEKK